MFGNLKKDNMAGITGRDGDSKKDNSKKNRTDQTKDQIKRTKIHIPISLKKSKFKSVFEELIAMGFNKVTYSTNLIEVSGPADLEYTIRISTGSMDVSANIVDKSHELKILLAIIRLASVISDYGSMNMNAVFGKIDAFLSDIHEFVDTSHVSLSAKYTNLDKKYHVLEKKYDDLVISSEQNARLLLECERRRAELESELNKLRRMTDKQLIAEVFNWIKLHNGKLNYSSFSKSHNVPQSRVEFAVKSLMKGGYIEMEK